MITRLSAYITDCVDPHINLAVEEYLTFHVEPSECILYLWQNKHTVVIGKNQNAWKECNVYKLEEDGGHLVRRLSGGGAVYHDLGNLNFTFCVREEDYDLERQMNVILQAVRKLGIDAVKTGRNDITVGGRKFSGNAFYKSKGYCYHHGTLLVDVDQTQMQKYLTVSVEKLRSKGVDSVRSRTVNLKEFNPELTMEQLKECLLESFGEVYGTINDSMDKTKDSEVNKNEQTIECVPVKIIADNRLNWAEIEKHQQRLQSQEWKFGRKIPFEHSLSKRFSWGEIEIKLQVNGGIVQDVIVYSDAMEQDLAKQLSGAFRNCSYDCDQLIKKIHTVMLDSELESQIKQDIQMLLADYLRG